MHASVFAFALLSLRMALASESNEEEYIRRQSLNGIRIGNGLYMLDEDSSSSDGGWVHVKRTKDGNSNPQRAIRTPLGTMRFGKRDSNPLGTMRFGKRTINDEIVDEKRGGPLGTMRFGKR